MIITIDSNILLSIFAADSIQQKAKTLLIEYRSNDYIINDIIYLEIGVFFDELSVLDHYLRMLEINHIKKADIDPQRIIAAWKSYLRKKLHFCPQCQEKIVPECPVCHTSLPFRQKILPDFMIADFVMKHSDGLITFDQSYYRNYFPSLRIFN